LIRVSTVGLLFALAFAAASEAAPPPAAGGVGVLRCLEQTGRVGLVAQLREPHRLDRHGWSAGAEVERVLGRREGSGSEETTIPIVWEELATARPARFGDDERVLLCLEALPGASIWRERLPDAVLRERTLSVAEGGDAFVRRPSLATLTLLDHYLVLAAEDRQGAPGAAYLARLSRDGELPLARDAVDRLARLPGLDGLLDSTAGGWLVAALLRPDADSALQDEIVRLVAERRPEAIRPALRTKLSDPAAPAVLYIAWAALEDGLSVSVARELLARGSPAHRLAAARAVTGEESARILVPLVRGDPEPQVRAAAVARLIALRAPEALDAGLAALRDEDTGVRAEAAHGLAMLGGRSVPGLLDVVEMGPAAASQAAVLALSGIDPEGLVALREVAASHADPGIRMLARMALGQDMQAPH
jgi:hypothetical protein